MNLQAQKIELIQLLLNTTKLSVINKVKNLLVQESEDVIGITEDGSPLTIALLEKDINEAEADIKSGRTYSTDDLRKHFQTK
jgi:hypothetical protein